MLAPLDDAFKGNATLSLTHPAAKEGFYCEGILSAERLLM